MRYRLLGRSGIRVSELCLGTMTFGDDWGWGAPKDTCRRILDAFEEAGGTFVDTADKYTNGSSEAILGELLEGRRDRFVLGSKYTLQTDPDDLNSAGSHRKNLVTSLEATLRRLRTDRLDVLWVHARDDWTPVPELMRALDDQVRAGKVLHVGVSDWPAWEVSAANVLADLRGWSPFVALQIQHSLLERTPDRDLLPMARAFELAVTAWSPLAGGLLTGKHRGGGERDGRPTGSPTTGQTGSSTRSSRSRGSSAPSRRRWRSHGRCGARRRSSRSSERRRRPRSRKTSRASTSSSRPSRWRGSTA